VALPFAAVWLFNSFGVIGVVALVGGILIAQAAIVLTLGVDTNQRSLEALLPSTPLPGASLPTVTQAGPLNV
jgi:putative MFS transporter